MFLLFPALRAPLAGPGRHTHAHRFLLTAAAVVVGVPTPVLAQTRLAPVVVVATREPLPVDQVTADVVVIDAQRIRESAADSIEDLLRREAGVQMSRSGAPGQPAGIFIRGASSSSTLVLIDGVRVGSATLGLVSFEAISLSQIERIEVLRGPGSSLYGADALGGVVQITTRRGEGPPSLSARYALGEYRSREGDVGISGGTGGYDYAASLSHESSHSVSALREGDAFGNFNLDRDGFRRRTAQVRLGYTVAPGHRVGVSVLDARSTSHYDGAEFAAPDFAQDVSPNFRTRLDTQVAALSYDGVISSAWTTRVQLAHNEDDSLSGGNLRDRFVTRRDQYTWQNAFRLAPGQQIVTVLERLEERAQSDSFVSDRDRHNDSLGVVYAGTFGAHNVSADLRRDDNSVYGGKTTGRLGWGVGLGHGFSLRALAGTTFRAPTFNDLYFRGYGVDTIRPERGRSVEVGVDWRAGDSTASVTAYRNRVRGLIGYESDRSFCPPDFEYDFGCARNIDRARLQGATFSAGHRMGPWNLRGTLDLLSARNERTGERLVRRAKHQETLAADYGFETWSVGASLVSLGARPDGGRRLGAYATLDLQARWRFTRHWQLEAKVLNAGDRDVEPARDYRGLGRQAWLGVRYNGLGL